MSEFYQPIRDAMTQALKDTYVTSLDYTLQTQMYRD